MTTSLFEEGSTDHHQRDPQQTHPEDRRCAPSSPCFSSSPTPHSSPPSSPYSDDGAFPAPRHHHTNFVRKMNNGSKHFPKHKWLNRWKQETSSTEDGHYHQHAGSSGGVSVHDLYRAALAEEAEQQPEQQQNPVAGTKTMPAKPPISPQEELAALLRTDDAKDRHGYSSAASIPGVVRKPRTHYTMYRTTATIPSNATSELSPLLLELSQAEDKDDHQPSSSKSQKNYSDTEYDFIRTQKRTSEAAEREERPNIRKHKRPYPRNENQESDEEEEWKPKDVVRPRPLKRLKRKRTLSANPTLEHSSKCFTSPQQPNVVVDPAELETSVKAALSTASVNPESIVNLLNKQEDRESVIRETGFSNNYIMKLQRKVLHSSSALQLRPPDVRYVDNLPLHVIFAPDGTPMLIKKELCDILRMKGTTFSYWKKKSGVEEIDTSQDFRLMDQCRSIFGGRSTYTLYTASNTLTILNRMESSRQKNSFCSLVSLKNILEGYVPPAAEKRRLSRPEA
ncbi:SAM domain-containing protein [Balamuthia mandrillaris]